MALLTTEDVLNKKFQYVKFREGYDQVEVDEFLDEVVSTIYALQVENQDLKEKLEAAERRIAELSEGVASEPVVAEPVAAEKEKVEEEAAPVVEEATPIAEVPTGQTPESATAMPTGRPFSVLRLSREHPDSRPRAFSSRQLSTYFKTSVEPVSFFFRD